MDIGRAWNKIHVFNIRSAGQNFCKIDPATAPEGVTDERIQTPVYKGRTIIADGCLTQYWNSLPGSTRNSAILLPVPGTA